MILADFPDTGNEGKVNRRHTSTGIQNRRVQRGGGGGGEGGEGGAEAQRERERERAYFSVEIKCCHFFFFFSSSSSSFLLFLFFFGIIAVDL